MTSDDEPRPPLDATNLQEVVAQLEGAFRLALQVRPAGSWSGLVNREAGETGTIAVGHRADLVLLAGNPLADIRYASQNTLEEGALSMPTVVMIGGRWLARAELRRRLAAR